MSPRRGDLVAPPSVGTEYTIRFGNNDAARGWEDLCRSAAGNLRRCLVWVVWAGPGHPKLTE